MGDSMSAHITSIIENKLSISYEEEDAWVSDDGKEEETTPPQAVLLLTRCCPNNHDHVDLSKMEAVKLAHWLHRFITGEYDE
jgi:hypothetical protein